MGMRTIVEFNHDKAVKIDEDPNGFIGAIMVMLNSGVSENDSETKELLKRFGITASPTHHNSGKSEVVLMTEHG